MLPKKRWNAKLTGGVDILGIKVNTETYVAFLVVVLDEEKTVVFILVKRDTF